MIAQNRGTRPHSLTAGSGTPKSSSRTIDLETTSPYQAKFRGVLLNSEPDERNLAPGRGLTLFEVFGGQIPPAQQCQSSPESGREAYDQRLNQQHAGEWHISSYWYLFRVRPGDGGHKTWEALDRPGTSGYNPRPSPIPGTVKE